MWYVTCLDAVGPFLYVIWNVSTDIFHDSSEMLWLIQSLDIGIEKLVCIRKGCFNV